MKRRQWFRTVAPLAGSAVFATWWGRRACSSPQGEVDPALRDREGSFFVPFHYDRDVMPYVVVQAQVDGHSPLDFLLDTGVSMPLLIDDDAAESMHLQTTGEHINVPPGNDRFDRAAVGVITLKSGSGLGLTIHPKDAYIGNLESINDTYGGSTLSGVIGAPLLAQTACRFDFAARRITVFVGDNALPPLPGETRVSMKEEYGRYYVPVSVQDSGDTWLLVDLGSSRTTLASKRAARLTPLAVTSGISGSFAEDRIGDEYLLDRFRIGEFSEPEVAIETVPDDDDAAVGLDFLSRFILTLDFRNRSMSLARPGDYHDRIRLPGWTGIGLADHDGRFYVQDVEPGSPAANAGIQAGDRLLRVDGEPIAQQSPAVVLGLLRGHTGTRATIVTARGGRSAITSSFERPSEFARPRSPLAGLTLTRSEDGNLIVAGVERGSPAEENGLRKEMEVEQINGLNAKEMERGRMALELMKPVVHIVLNSPDQDRPLDLILHPLPPSASDDRGRR